jgi:hypothetical protein
MNNKARTHEFINAFIYRFIYIEVFNCALIILSCVLVTIDGVWIGCLDLLAPYTHHSKLWVITALPLISALYSSLLQTLVSSVYYSLHYPLSGNGFYHRNYKSLTELHTTTIAVL